MQSIDDHDGWAYDVRIDTSATRPDAAARTVLAMLAGA